MRTISDLSAICICLLMMACCTEVTGRVWFPLTKAQRLKMTCCFIFSILIWVSFISGPKYNIDLSLKSFTFMSVYIALFSGWWIIWIEYLAASCAEGSWQMQLAGARYTLRFGALFASWSRPLLAWHLHIRAGIKRHGEQARMAPAQSRISSRHVPSSPKIISTIYPASKPRVNFFL